ncbi:MAG: hypothetical protein KGD72_03935 [Candidatus Lokiarchaeota archaeon]|nr:hypothetical protein [Candidatus Lokiarchaeota archaeon]
MSESTFKKSFKQRYSNIFLIKIFQLNFKNFRGSELELIDAQNDRHILKAKVGPIIPVNFQDSEGNQSILVQSFGTFELDGMKGGYGTFETLRRVRKLT